MCLMQWEGQGALSLSPLSIYSHRGLLIPFLRQDILGISRTMEEIDLLDLIPGSEEVEEDCLVYSFLFRIFGFSRELLPLGNTPLSIGFRCIICLIFTIRLVGNCQEYFFCRDKLS